MSPYKFVFHLKHILLSYLTYVFSLLNSKRNNQRMMYLFINNIPIFKILCSFRLLIKAVMILQFSQDVSIKILLTHLKKEMKIKKIKKKKKNKDTKGETFPTPGQRRWGR